MKTDHHPPTPVDTVALPERLDALTAEAVYAEIHKRLDARTTRLGLDASAMTYISSKGIRTLLRIRTDLNQHGGTLVIDGLQDFAREVLAASGLDDDLRNMGSEDDRTCR